MSKSARFWFRKCGCTMTGWQRAHRAKLNRDSGSKGASLCELQNFTGDLHKDLMILMWRKYPEVSKPIGNKYAMAQGHDFRQIMCPQRFLYSGAITSINRPWAAGCSGQHDEARDLQHIAAHFPIGSHLDASSWGDPGVDSRGSCCLKFVVSNSLLGPLNLCNIHCPSSNLLLESGKCCTIGRQPARKGEKATHSPVDWCRISSVNRGAGRPQEFFFASLTCHHCIANAD